MTKERPIIFSAPMVRAILAGTKSQTRRALKSQPPADNGSLLVDEIYPVVIDRWGDDQPGVARYGVTTNDGEWCLPCPYGQPGDRLWVRETCRAEELDSGLDGVRYLADGAFLPIENTQDASDQWAKLSGYRGQKCATIPSVYMPRWANRITLEITGVRVERLLGISGDDCISEGAWPIESKALGRSIEAIHAYATLWESINGPDSWDANPWVWVIEFKRVTP